MNTTSKLLSQELLGSTSTSHKTINDDRLLALFHKIIGSYKNPSLKKKKFLKVKSWRQESGNSWF